MTASAQVQATETTQERPETAMRVPMPQSLKVLMPLKTGKWLKRQLRFKRQEVSTVRLPDTSPPTAWLVLRDAILHIKSTRPSTCHLSSNAPAHCLGKQDAR